MNDFQKDLKIDEFSLDAEWKKQPELFAKWATEAVNASYQVDKAKERLDLVRAELDSEIRNVPVKYGIEKITETAISSAILKELRYQEASADYLEKNKMAKTLTVARDAFEHRKKALESITQLFLANYYAEPYIPKKAEKIVDNENSKAAQTALKDSMNKRKLNRDA